MNEAEAGSALRQVLNSIQPIGDAAWDALAPSVRAKTLAKGDLFIRAGDDSVEAGLVLSGVMRTYYSTPDGDEVVTAFCVQGSFSCAYAAALAYEPATVTIEALTPCALVAFDMRRFRALVESESIWSIIGRRVVEADYIAQERRLSQLLTQDAKARVEAFRANYKELWTTVSQKDIASYLGITRETLNRLVNRR